MGFFLVRVIWPHRTHTFCSDSALAAKVRGKSGVGQAMMGVRCLVILPGWNELARQAI